MLIVYFQLQLKAVYKKVLNDHLNSLDELVGEFPHDPHYMVRIKSNSDSGTEEEAAQTPSQGVGTSNDEASSTDGDIEEVAKDVSDEDSEVLTQAARRPPTVRYLQIPPLSPTALLQWQHFEIQLKVC